MGAYDCDCINNLEYDRRERKAQLSKEGTTKGATSDLISRQQTLNALMDAVKSVGVLDADDIKTVFDALPSVQHEKAQLSQEDTTSDQPVATDTNVGDTISRQAAIDAIVQCTNCGDEDTLREYVLKHSLDNGWTGGILEALDAVKDLPPIQPEPQWIPVSERLPETGVEVLTYDEALNYIEIQTVSDGRWENQRGDWQDLDDIAAWMPLPEAYKPNNE